MLGVLVNTIVLAAARLVFYVEEGIPQRSHQCNSDWYRSMYCIHGNIWSSPGKNALILILSIVLGAITGSNSVGY